jgi:hypothetical protein
MPRLLNVDNSNISFSTHRNLTIFQWITVVILRPLLYLIRSLLVLQITGLNGSNTGLNAQVR